VIVQQIGSVQEELRTSSDSKSGTCRRKCARDQTANRERVGGNAHVMKQVFSPRSQSVSGPAFKQMGRWVDGWMDGWMDCMENDIENDS
jgi:hypothetical protein